MTTSTHSSSGTIFESEPEPFGEHNVWNLVLGLFAHHTCSPVLQRSLRDEDLCKGSLFVPLCVGTYHEQQCTDGPEQGD